MGATESKTHQDSDLHVKDDHKNKTKESDDGADHHTPVANRRLVKLRDPRSPTDGVQRTPIIVPKPGEHVNDDSFEDPRSPTSKISRSPIPDTDPRSPTAGMSRTPCPFTYPDPRSPTANVARTPLAKESESGRFEMPSEAQNEKIEEEAEDTKVQEIENASNNNSSDRTRLINQSDASKVQDPASSNAISAAMKSSTENGPRYQLGDIPESLPTEVEADDSQRRSLIVTDKAGPTKKSRSASLTKSIKAKISGGSHSTPPRSPLSTRNMDKDALGAVHIKTADRVLYNKAGSRRGRGSGTPTRLVGKYEPIIDKENL